MSIHRQQILQTTLLEMGRPTALLAVAIRGTLEVMDDEYDRYFNFTIRPCAECPPTKPGAPGDPILRPKAGAKIDPNKRYGGGAHASQSSKRSAAKAGRAAGADVNAAKAIARPNFVNAAYHKLVALIFQAQRTGRPVNDRAARFLQDFKERTKSPVLLSGSCEPADKLKILLCQLESDIHLGVLRSDITSISTGYGNVFTGAPEGIDAAVQFARSKIEVKATEIEAAIFHTK